MATLTIKKPTAGNQFISDLGIIIPGSGQDSFTDPATIKEVCASNNLRSLVTSGTLVVNDGTSDLSVQVGLLYLTQLYVQAGFDTPANRTTYGFGVTFSVPTAGTLQLQGPGNAIEGYRISRAGRITAGSIRVNAGDSSRTYNLDIRVNGSSVATVPLALSTLSNSLSNLSVSVAVGDIMTAFLVRTSGSGASTFGEMLASVEVTV
jgi:hypothetical protein